MRFLRNGLNVPSDNRIEPFFIELGRRLNYTPNNGYCFFTK
jgi:hypothetical protein